MSELFAGFSRHVGVTLLRHDAAFRLKNSGPRSLSFTRLISAKNLYPKHRFFALFRRAFRDVTFESEVSFTSTLMEPDFLAKSERFAGKARHV